MTRICKRCKQEKPLSSFGKGWTDKKGKIWYKYSCCACRSQRYRNKGNNRQKVQANAKRTTAAYRDRVPQMKLDLFKELGQSSCKVCSYSTNPAGLCFHHRNPEEKRFTIKYAFSHTYGFSNILKEALKCDVVCINCHRLIHYKGDKCKHKEGRKTARNALESKKRIIKDMNHTHCQKCPESNPIVLSFHHREPLNKTFDISWGIYNRYPYEEVLEEARKCDILCSRCHFEVEADIRLSHRASHNKAG